LKSLDKPKSYKWQQETSCPDVGLHGFDVGSNHPGFSKNCCSILAMAGGGYP